MPKQKTEAADQVAAELSPALEPARATDQPVRYEYPMTSGVYTRMPDGSLKQQAVKPEGK